MKLIDRFLTYVAIDTSSDEKSQSYPSTAKQFDLLKLLEQELNELKLSEVKLTKKGYLTATLESNTTSEVPTLAFIAHVDTSPEVSGTNVCPRLIDYQGGDIQINDNLTLSSQRLVDYLGDKIITTDGTTLLGADDKAGVAAIMNALEYLTTHPEIIHGKIRVLFTPDEEVGRGVDYLDVNELAADYAYTVDGGECGSLEWETFNAASATVRIKGINYHPGYAKGVMINSQKLAMDFHQRLPKNQTPELTQEREGFYHLISMQGDVESSTLHYIIRDHDRQIFEERKQKISSLAEEINSELGKDFIEIDIKDQYYNMGEVIKNHFQTVEIASEAMISLGIEPKISAIRGGTDGSRLSFMGLPCPNIFTGAENIHSRLEFVSERVMLLSSKTLVKIVEIFYQKSLHN